jgi:hypothetical protein
MEPTNKLRPAAYASGTISIGSWLARVNRISTDNTAILAQIAKKKVIVYYSLPSRGIEVGATKTRNVINSL